MSTVSKKQVLLYQNIEGLTEERLHEDLSKIDGIDVFDNGNFYTISLEDDPDCYISFYSPKKDLDVYFFTLGDTMPSPIIHKLKQVYEGLDFSLEL